MLVVVHTSTEVLLIKRVDHENFWQSVTGSLEWGESAHAAAVRELTEETGLTDVSLRATGITRSYKILEAWKFRYHPDASRNLETLFYCSLPSRCDIALEPSEHSEYEWVSFAQAQRKASSWTNRLSVANFV